MADQKNNTGKIKTGERKTKTKPNRLTYSETFVATAPLGTWKAGRTK